MRSVIWSAVKLFVIWIWNSDLEQSFSLEIKYNTEIHLNLFFCIVLEKDSDCTHDILVTLQSLSI